MGKMKRFFLVIGYVLLRTLIIVTISMVLSFLISYFTDKPLIRIIEFIAMIIVIVGVLSMLGDISIRGKIQYNLTKFLLGTEKSMNTERINIWWI